MKSGFLFKLSLFIFRDRECEQRRDREKGERISNRLCAEPRVGLEPMKL